MSQPLACPACGSRNAEPILLVCDCRLYVTVITTIRGFGDLFWVDVVEQIDTMTEQVNNFQNQAKKLPKALRDWQAFVDCKKVIDDFLEELPLFQQLASKAMRPR